MAMSLVATATSTLTTTATSVNLSTPASVLDNDLIVATVMTRSALTVPSGWTLVDSQAVTELSQVTSVCVRQASSDASHSYTWTQASSARLVVHYQVFRGVSSYSPTTLLKKTQVPVNGVKNTISLSGVTPPTNDYLTIICGSAVYAGSSAQKSNWAGNPSTDLSITTPNSVTDDRIFAAYNMFPANSFPLTEITYDSPNSAGITGTSFGLIVLALEGTIAVPNLEVDQAEVLVLGQADSKAVVDQLALLALVRQGANVQVDQMALLFLSRRYGKRVFTQIDIGNQ